MTTFQGAHFILLLNVVTEDERGAVAYDLVRYLKCKIIVINFNINYGRVLKPTRIN